MSTAIATREHLRPGDIGEITRLHGSVYSRKCGHGVAFAAYVAAGLAEFYQHYAARLDRLWLCEDNDSLVGMLFLVRVPGGVPVDHQ